MDLTFTDLRQLANVASGLCDIIRHHGLCRVTGEFVEAVEYRTQLEECVEATMGSLRKFEALLFSEQPLDEPIQLLSADEGDMGEAFPRLRDLDANQSERRASFLMPGSRFHSPITRIRNSSLTASRLSNSGNSPPHNALTASRGDADMTGEAMSPRNRVRTAWNGTGHR